MNRIITFSISLLCFVNVCAQTDTLQRRDTLNRRDSLQRPDALMRSETWPVSIDSASRNSVGLSEGHTNKNKRREQSEGPIYKLKPLVDIPLTAIATAFDLHAFKVIYNKPGSSPGQIDALNKSDINGFDRWAADVYRGENAAKTSDMLFYGSMPLPLLLFIDKDIRKDAAKIAFLYLETMSITGIFYTGSAYLVDRYRPLTYVNSTNDPQLRDRQINGNAKNSFLAGHPALVATSTFFMAKVYSDYHPNSGFRHVLYGLAIAATGTTAYLRHLAGRHFPSDLIVGTAMGTLTGILVPHFHKNKTFKNSKMTILPFSGQSHGIAMVYKL